MAWWREQGLLTVEGASYKVYRETEGLFTRRAEARLPDELPLPVKAFILWLVIILWERESDSGPAAGGAGTI